MRSTMLDMDSRVRVATAVEKDETQASRSVFDILQRRGHPNTPPPTISDGWAALTKPCLPSTVMAEGLANHAWTVYELLTTIPLKR